MHLNHYCHVWFPEPSTLFSEATQSGIADSLQPSYQNEFLYAEIGILNENTIAYLRHRNACSDVTCLKVFCGTQSATVINPACGLFSAAY